VTCVRELVHAALAARAVEPHGTTARRYRRTMLNSSEPDRADGVVVCSLGRDFGSPVSVQGGPEVKLVFGGVVDRADVVGCE
jgi:hypothetical protein